MRKVIFIVMAIQFIMTSCEQKTQNRSRQFQKDFVVKTLSEERDEINFKIRCYYDFYQDSEKLFTDKGYFADKKDSIDFLLEPTVRAATRQVVKKYSSKDLYIREIHDVQEEFYQESKILLQASDFKGGVKIRINQYIFLDDIVYPSFVDDLAEEGLLAELDMLKSNSPSQRMEGAAKLITDGSEAAYNLVLEHWSKEKDQSVRDFITKKLRTRKYSSNKR